MRDLRLAIRNIVPDRRRELSKTRIRSLDNNLNRFVRTANFRTGVKSGRARKARPFRSTPKVALDSRVKMLARTRSSVHECLLSVRCRRRFIVV